MERLGVKTQKAFAQMIGVTPVTLNRLLKGTHKPSGATLQRLIELSGEVPELQDGEARILGLIERLAASRETLAADPALIDAVEDAVGAALEGAKRAEGARRARKRQRAG